MKKIDRRTLSKVSEGASLNVCNIVLKPSARRQSKSKLSTCACGNKTLNADKVCAVCNVFQRVKNKLTPELLDAFGMRPRMEIYGGMSY